MDDSFRHTIETRRNAGRDRELFLILDKIGSVIETTEIGPGSVSLELQNAPVSSLPRIELAPEPNNKKGEN